MTSLGVNLSGQTEALTELHDELEDALEREGYPCVAITRIDENTFGAAGFRSLEDLAAPKVRQWRWGRTRQEALRRLLESVA